MTPSEPHPPTGSMRFLGITIATGAEGATVSMAVGEDHTNRHGNMHGGLIATVLDTAMGATASYLRGEGGRIPFSTISLTVNFLAPIPMGVITASGRVMGGGFKTVFVEGIARSDDGTIVAQATGTFKRAPV